MLEIKDDHRVKREEDRMRPVEIYCKEVLEMGVDGAKVIDSYQKAILLHRQLRKGEKAKPFSETIVNFEVKIFLDGYYKAWSMGSGPCRLCKECDPTTSCKHGFEARPSMEACGIDVFKTARDNGFTIEVVKTHEEERNIFGLILVE